MITYLMLQIWRHWELSLTSDCERMSPPVSRAMRARCLAVRHLSTRSRERALRREDVIWQRSDLPMCAALGRAAHGLCAVVC